MKGFARPKAVVLGAKALVPKSSRIVPAPTHFTHAIVRRQPYFFLSRRRSHEPDGHFAKGTKVVLLGRGGGRLCRVADRRGLYVEVECASLRQLG